MLTKEGGRLIVGVDWRVYRVRRLRGGGAGTGHLLIIIWLGPRVGERRDVGTGGVLRIRKTLKSTKWLHRYNVKCHHNHHLISGFKMQKDKSFGPDFALVLPLIQFLSWWAPREHRKPWWLRERQESRGSFPLVLKGSWWPMAWVSLFI